MPSKPATKPATKPPVLVYVAPAAGPAPCADCGGRAGDDRHVRGDDGAWPVGGGLPYHDYKPTR